MGVVYISIRLCIVDNDWNRENFNGNYIWCTYMYIHHCIITYSDSSSCVQRNFNRKFMYWCMHVVVYRRAKMYCNALPYWKVLVYGGVSSL